MEIFLKRVESTYRPTNFINKLHFEGTSLYLIAIPNISWGLGWRSGKGTALLVGRSQDRSPVVSLVIFPGATDETMCPGVDSVSKNEYQKNIYNYCYSLLLAKT